MSGGNWLKGAKPSEAPGRGNPKIHGEIPGYPVGSTFRTRPELSAAAVHAPIRAGIHGGAGDSAYSVVLSFGYEDDEDHGENFIYTGQGGRDSNVSKIDKMQGKESWETVQTRDQEWVRGNKALQISSVTGRPVRVIRGTPQKGKPGSPYAPAEGYRYDGLYQVIRAWREKGKTGFTTCRFEFQRLPNQKPLPGSGAVVKTYSQPIPGLSRSTPELPAIHIQRQSQTFSHLRNNAVAGPSRVTKPHTPRPPYRPPSEFLKSRQGTSDTTVVAGPSHSKRRHKDDDDDDEDMLEEWSTASRDSIVAADVLVRTSGKAYSDKSDMKGRKKQLPNISFKKIKRSGSEEV
ncbi:putative SAD/SRA domain containing protein [Lyophyllum shimeji]|uniref:SAD/SRA domain containing protein n=1 Tax=Lyophyllum shimeji TaxID=47721 RepID=A0A9P3PRS8_LYOSH|nr:putative SAD/SRA domain containing protein [Lyophyllum shimeji]